MERADEQGRDSVVPCLVAEVRVLRELFEEGLAVAEAYRQTAAPDAALESHLRSLRAIARALPTTADAH